MVDESHLHRHGLSRLDGVAGGCERLGNDVDLVQIEGDDRGGKLDLKAVELGQVGLVAVDAEIVGSALWRCEIHDLLGLADWIGGGGGEDGGLVRTDQFESEILLQGGIKGVAPGAGSVGILRTFEEGAGTGNDTHGDLRIGWDGQGKAVDVPVAIDAQPFELEGGPGRNRERGGRTEGVVVAGFSVLLVEVTVPPLQGIDVVELNAAKTGIDERLHEFGVVGGADVLKAQGVAVLVFEGVGESDGVVEGVAEPTVLGVEDGVALVGEEAVGNGAAVAIDGVPGEADVAADLEPAG